ncbi:MAG: YciI family protein [Minicystis sp.]
MSKIFAVLVETVDGYGDYALKHPDHNQRQRAWFMAAANEGKLLACGPYAAQDGAGLWLLRAASREDAEAIVRTSPRFLDGMLSMDRSRIVEWSVSIGKERFA